eukprot:SAG22_NODE_7985_length_693_cov_1.021886_2_plen_104_part_00
MAAASDGGGGPFSGRRAERRPHGSKRAKKKTRHKKVLVVDELEMAHEYEVEAMAAAVLEVQLMWQTSLAREGYGSGFLSRWAAGTGRSLALQRKRTGWSPLTF